MLRSDRLKKLSVTAIAIGYAKNLSAFCCRIFCYISELPFMVTCLHLTAEEKSTTKNDQCKMLGFFN
jgi:hypothetical protein